MREVSLFSTLLMICMVCLSLASPCFCGFSLGSHRFRYATRVLTLAVLGYLYSASGLNAQAPENRICSGTLLASKGAPDVALEIRTKEGMGSCFFVRGSPVAERILATCALNEPCKVWAVVGRSGSLFAIVQVREVKREGEEAQTAQSETEQGFLGFKTPSGNIQCMFFDSVEARDPPSLRCDMADMTNPIPPKPSSCDLDWGGAFYVSQESKRGERVCHGDTVFGESVEVLPYGSVWQHHGFTCLSEQNGLTCFNAKRHGFALSRSSQKLF